MYESSLFQLIRNSWKLILSFVFFLRTKKIVRIVFVTDPYFHFLWILMKVETVEKPNIQKIKKKQTSREKIGFSRAWASNAWPPGFKCRLSNWKISDDGTISRWWNFHVKKGIQHYFFCIYQSSFIYLFWENNKVWSYD